jgi:hypothetical protein
MFTYVDSSFFPYFLYYLLVIFLIFYIPGNIFIRPLVLSRLQQFVLSIVIGITLWSLQGIIFASLGMRFLSYLYILIFCVLWIKRTYKSFSLPKLNVQVLRQHVWLICIITLGTLIQLLSIWFTGVSTSQGLYFCCALPDSLFHIALTNELTHNFPPFEPGIHDMLLRNYHYLPNLINADITRMFQIPLLTIQYPLTTILFSLLLGLTAVVFAQLTKLPKAFTFWLLFFLYFSGNFLYILTFFTKGTVDFSFVFLEIATSLWISPPRVIAIVLFFAGLSFFLLWIKQKNIYAGLLMALIFGSLIGYKVYVGIFALSGLGIVALYYLFKRQFTMLIPPIFAVLISLALYLPVNSGAGGLVYTGTWRFENFIVQVPLGLSHLENARLVYLAHNNWLRVVQHEIIFALLYIVFVFGTITLGVFQTKKSLRLFPKELNFFLLTGIFTSAILGFFFIQKTGGANSVQFLISIQILGSIYAALACTYWINKFNTSLRILLISLVVLITIPSVTYATITNFSYIKNFGGILISKNELQAFEYLKRYAPPEKVILTSTINGCLIVTILTNHPLFVCNDGAPPDRGVDTPTKLALANSILTGKDPKLVQTLLKENNISYIHLRSHESLGIPETVDFLKPFYSNDKIKILEVIY